MPKQQLKGVKETSGYVWVLGTWIDNILDELGDSRYFSMFGSVQDYHKLLINRDNREKTAFSLFY